MDAEIIMTNIERNVHSALIDAKTAVRNLDGHHSESETYNLRKEVGASLIALQGLQSISVAEALYLAYSNEEGENQVLDDIIHQYKVFVREVITDTATDHSHQWSYIEFDHLREAARGTRYWSDVLDSDGSDVE